MHVCNFELLLLLSQTRATALLSRLHRHRLNFDEAPIRRSPIGGSGSAIPTWIVLTNQFNKANQWSTCLLVWTNQSIYNDGCWVNSFTHKRWMVDDHIECDCVRVWYDDKWTLFTMASNLHSVVQRGNGKEEIGGICEKRRRVKQVCRKEVPCWQGCKAMVARKEANGTECVIAN